MEFQLKGACEVYSKKEALDAFEKYVQMNSGQWYLNRAKERKMLENVLNGDEKEFSELLDPAVAVKSKRFTITSLRNSNSIAYLDTLFRFFKESQDADLKTLLSEAFGWYTNSYKRDEIIDFCKEQSLTEKSEVVKKELVRTINRLTN